MLKGKTIIELTDVLSGQKERLEEGNMITNALTKFFEPLGHLKNPDALFNTQSPAYANALGGLLMFDSALEERRDLLFAPPGVNLTGCAVYGKQNDTTGKKRGAYNTTESEVNRTDRYIKYVYDFATSQANGTIASICLTHTLGGYTTLGADDAVRASGLTPMLNLCSGTMHYVYPGYTGGSTGDRTTYITPGTTELLFVIDKDEDLAYYLKISSKTSISIVKRRANLKSVSVFESPCKEHTIQEQFTLPDLSLGLLNASYFSYNFDNEEKALYLVSTADTSSLAAGGTFRVTRISFGDWAVTEYTCTNQTNAPLAINSSAHYTVFIYRGYLYVKGYNTPYTLYKISITDPADVTQIQMDSSVTLNAYPIFALNGRIFLEAMSSYEGYGRAYVLDTQTNRLQMMEAYLLSGSSSYTAAYTPFLGDDFYFYVSYGTSTSGSIRGPAMYLATINNLTTPVTKTADKTMKVTYIIQEQ